MQARALFFVAPRTVEVREVPVPALAAGDVLVATSWSGISAGSELLAYRGELDAGLALDETLGALGGTFAYPFRYGYSCVGRVEDTQAELAHGSLVFAFHPHQDLFVAPAAYLVVLDGADPRAATLLPLVETALQVSLDAGPVAHEAVVVIGLGVVGILSAALLARSGARVVAAEPRAFRRDTAAAFGITAVDPAELADAVAAETEGCGVPLLVEASGSPEALRAGPPLLAHEGTALVASWYGARPVTLPLGAEFHRRRLSIRSSQVSTVPAAQQARWNVPRRRAAARALLAELPLRALTTHDFPVAEAAEAFDAVDRAEDGLPHAALCYWVPHVRSGHRHRGQRLARDAGGGPAPRAGCTPTTTGWTSSSPAASSTSGAGSVTSTCSTRRSQRRPSTSLARISR